MFKGLEEGKRKQPSFVIKFYFVLLLLAFL